MPIYLSSKDYAEIEKHLGRTVPGKQYDTTEIVRKSYKALYGSFIDPTLLSPGVVTIAKVEENGPYSMRLMLKAEEAPIRSIFALHHLHFIKTRVVTTYPDASYESEMDAHLRQFLPPHVMGYLFPKYNTLVKEMQQAAHAHLKELCETKGRLGPR